VLRVGDAAGVPVDGIPVSPGWLRGKTVLLYFQEGLMCQPCWHQISDMEAHAADVRAAGIDQIVSITTEPVDLIAHRHAAVHAGAVRPGPDGVQDVSRQRVRDNGHLP